jgi:phage terminase large subunit-like protein
MQPKLTPFIPHRPTPKQAAFLLLPHRDCLFGGSAGGGKSDALLMAALQYVDIPEYAALLLRRTYADLALPGALMDRAAEWLMPTAAKWSEQEKTWTFPSGATVTFGYLEIDKHKYRYQSSEFQMIGFDELTQFQELMFRYLFSRLRRLKGSSVPIRMRSASNPGGEGHEWVYERYVVPNKKPDRIFIPAGLVDNPYIDQKEYIESLSELDDITRQQLLEGLWITDPQGKPFKREWWRGQNRFHLDDKATQSRVIARYLSFDTALTDKDDSAYTACVVGELLPDYRLLIRWVWRDKLIFPDLIDFITQTSTRFNQDGKLKAVLIEDKASGISAYQTLTQSTKSWLAQMIVPFTPIGDKTQRAQQAAVWCKRGCVQLPHPDDSTEWLYEFESELFSFPASTFKDQVDTFDQLVIYLENVIAVGHHARDGSV